MTATVRVGVVGTGFIGAVHVRAAARAGATSIAVADATPEIAEAAAQRMRADRFFASSDELIESDEIDVVHVCTPNHLHAPLVEKALAAGKHVVCEKPLAIDVESAARLTALAEEAGVVNAVPFVYRYYPTVRDTRGRIARGDAGKLHLFHGSYLQDWLARETDNNWRVNPALGGSSRAFGDIGIHWCDLVEFVTGHRIVRLSAMTATPLARFADDKGNMAPVTTEDIAAILFQTDLGATGTLVVSQVSLGRKNRLWFNIDGADASYSFDQENPDTLWIGGRDASTVVPRGSELMSPEGLRYAYLPTGHPQGYQDCFDALIADVYAAVRGEQPVGMPTFADGLRGARLTEAVLASARSGQWVDVSDVVVLPNQKALV
ncbi:Gfo/Idh/MocA family oxidoreductase [Motilibacter sp. E257]|uniref:Gfo/Idh/MocA family oxidoreductase n=2 Tax=Motilibacter deserti TaxID=2714956 RepID=A0ABX0GZ09_9ACTN|nr:Gfo/Idh/MocA family oxidoreductase [Motilibacter deserti]